MICSLYVRNVKAVGSDKIVEGPLGPFVFCSEECRTKYVEHITTHDKDAICENDIYDYDAMKLNGGYCDKCNVKFS